MSSSENDANRPPERLTGPVAAPIIWYPEGDFSPADPADAWSTAGLMRWSDPPGAASKASGEGWMRRVPACAPGPRKQEGASHGAFLR